MLMLSPQQVQVVALDPDPDVIIPDDIARPLVASSFLLLITAVVSIIRQEYGLAAATAALCVTSVCHWYRPRFSGWRRPADYLAVATVLTYGSVLTITRARSGAWIGVWFGGLACVGVIFVWNESMYYLQLQRKPTGGDIESSNAKSCAAHARHYCAASPVAPGDQSGRRAVFRRVAWVHLSCVHVLANALALVIVTQGLNPRS